MELTEQSEMCHQNYPFDLNTFLVRFGVKQVAQLAAPRLVLRPNSGQTAIC